MSDRISTDLIEIEGANPAKMTMLAPIRDCVATLCEFCDPDGANFEAFGKAGELIDQLYEIVEFKELA